MRGEPSLFHPVSTRHAGRAACALVAAVALLSGCSKNDHNPVAPHGAGPSLKIAFASERPPSTVGANDIYLYDVSTGAAATRPVNLDSPSDEQIAALSGNGAWLVFVSTQIFIGPSSTTLRYNIATGQITYVDAFDLVVGPNNPSVSYDGRYVAVQDILNGNVFDQEVTEADIIADTLVQTPHLHADGALDFDPSISRDGRLIAFASSRAPSIGGFNVLLYDVGGDSLIDLPNLNSRNDDLAPGISADGRYIAFESNRAGGAGFFDIYVYDRQTASLLPMPGANTALSDLTPTISPDGRYVAFATEAEGGTDIRLYDLQTQTLVSTPGMNDPYFRDRFPSLAEKH